MVRAIASSFNMLLCTTPRPKPVTCTSRTMSLPCASAMSKLVEFVPMSIAATGFSVARMYELRLIPSFSATQSPTGSLPPASHQPKCACKHFTPIRVPATPPNGRGPVWSAGMSASRSAAYLSCAAAMSAASSSASTWFTAPVASRRPINTFSRAPHSQYKVGIGVPSGSNG